MGWVNRRLGGSFGGYCTTVIPLPTVQSVHFIILQLLKFYSHMYVIGWRPVAPIFATQSSPKRLIDIHRIDHA